MRKKQWNKVIAGVMLLFILFTLAGCQNKEEQKEDLNELIYEEVELMTEEIGGVPVQYRIKDEILYVLSYKQKEEYFYIYKINLDEKDVSKILVKMQNGESVNAFFVDSDGSIMYMVSVITETEENIYEVVKVNAEGKELLRENVTNMIKNSANAILHNIEEDAEGNVILASCQNIYILDEKFQLVSNIQVKDGEQLIDFVRTKDGEIVCAISEEEMFHISTKLCKLNVKKHKWDKELKLDTELGIKGDCITDGTEYDFYYKNDGIYGYDIETKKGKKLLDATASYLTKQDIDGMIPTGNGEFVGKGEENRENKGVSFKLYTKVDAKDVANKKIITYGTSDVNDKLIKAAREFNKKNMDYRIEFKEYDMEMEEENRMRADIIAGNIPDIIDISCLGLSVEQCVAKGLLEDLTPYYEKDSEISTSDLVPAVLEGMKLDGKLYFLAPYFSINTMVGKKKDVGSTSGWNYDEIIELLEEKGEGTIPFNRIEKTDILCCFLLNGISDFVNWKTGECSFNSQDFKDIMELCNRGKDEEYDNLDWRNELRDGKILLKVYDAGITINDIQEDRQLFGEDITYVGYPNRKKEGSYFGFENMVGIYSNSQVKEQAWEFLRCVMEKEFQAKMLLQGYYAMPTRQDCFDLRVKALMTTETYTDEFGQVITPLETGTYMGIQYGPVSQEDVDIFIDLVEHTKKRNSFDEEMIMIVIEEAQAYFKGDKSLDKTTEIIQKRVSTYVNEQR